MKRVSPETIIRHTYKCRHCDTPARFIEKIESLPGGGISYKAIHDDGKEHNWEEWNSPELHQALSSPEEQTRRQEPRFVICPKCHKKGRVNHFVSAGPHKVGEPAIAYVIVHEKIAGKWGKTKLQKRRRCYITDPTQRTVLLRRLGLLFKKGRGRPKKQKAITEWTSQQKETKDKTMV